MPNSINNLLCTSCGECVESCPQNAISEHDTIYLVIDESLCLDCGTCIKTCKSNAIMAVNKNTTVSKM